MSRVAACLGSAALASTLLAAERRADAATPQTRMIYARAAEAAGCPDEAALRREVEARLGYDPFVSWGQGGVIVQVSRRGARYLAQIQVLDAQGISRGVRELSSEPHDCDELFHATALTLAIALRGAADLHDQAPAPAPSGPPTATGWRSPSGQASDEPPSPDAGSSSPPRRSAPPRPSPSPRPPAPSEPQWFVSARALGTLGEAPGGSLGAALGGRVQGRALSLGLEARVDFPRSLEVAHVGTSLSSFYAALVIPCAHARSFAFCGLAGMGALVASGRDVTLSASGASLRPLVGARVAFEWPLGGSAREPPRLALTALADGILDLRSTTLDLDGQEVWSTSPAVLSLGAGIVLRLP